jgi:hypothetical protein
MDPTEKQERKREALRRLRAQRQRAGRLRGRVVAISLIGFVLLWGVVFAQMATGNDPVLGNKSAIAAKPEKVADEAIETTDPEELEVPQEAEREAVEAAEASELEMAEIEAAEAELVEVEPEPVTTSQS